MKNTYNITLVPGNHGIWLFVKNSDKVIFEQPGIKSVEDALKFAQAIISGAEKELEAGPRPISKWEKGK